LVYNAGVPVGDQIEGLLADLSAITDVARAGVISRRAVKLEKGETRPAAVLYLDVVGFTSLARALDSEQLSTLIDRTFRIYELTVQGEGGYLDKVVGDAALYVFAGHPNHPPVCEAALRAALRLKERTNQVNASLGDDELAIAVRIGVAFGDVTRQQVGGQTAQITVMGETANIAQRLEACARPGTIQTSVRVLEKAGDVFAHTKLGKREVKGFGAVTVYEVTGVQQMPVELRGAFSQLTPLVGRSELLERATGQIHDWLQQGCSRRGAVSEQSEEPMTERCCLMLLSGATAVGKSRLAYELVERLKAEIGVATATAHCTDRASIRGFAAELAQVAGLDAGNLPQRWDELCARVAGALGPEGVERHRRHLPVLAYTLDCPQVDASSIAAGDPASFERACGPAIRACCELAAHSSGGVVVLVIEDLQWLGELRGFVKDVLESVRLGRPMIVIATARPEYYHAAGGLGEDGFSSWRLEPLDPEDGAGMLEALLPGLSLAAELLDELHAKAAGIPYYYEEFARMLVRRGLVTAGPSGYELAREIEGLDVPEDIRALILGRLDQLDPGLKGLTMRASVLGRAFPTMLLRSIEQEVGPDGAAGLTAGLEALVAQSVLVRESAELYFFEHLLVCDAAYSALLSHNRVVLHAAAARVLERMHAPGAADEVQLLSNRIRHLHRAGVWSDARSCCGELLLIKARSGQFGDWDNWEAIAEECASRLAGDGGAPLAGTSKLLRAQGVRLLRLGDYTAARATFDQALAAARAADDQLDEASALCDLGVVCRHMGEAETAMDYYQQCLAIARRHGAWHTEAVVLGNVGKVHYQWGERALAVAHYEQALDISRAHRDQRTEALMLTNLGNVHLDNGDTALAAENFAQVLDLARRSGNLISESVALSNLGVAAHDRGDRAAARRFYQQAAAIDRETGRREGEAFQLFNLGELACEEGDLPVALEYLDRCLSLFRQQQNAAKTILVLAFTGKVLAQLGRLEEAAKALTEATELCEGRQHMVERGIADCCWVHYHAAVGDRAAAQASFESACAASEASGAGKLSPLAAEVECARQAIVDGTPA